MAELPALAVTDAVGQLPASTGSVANRKWVGRLSVNGDDSVPARVFWLPSVSGSVEVPPATVCSAPGVIKLVYVPTTLDTTLTTTVQPTAGVTAPSAYVTVLLPAVALFVPGHEPLRAGVAAIVTPAGKLSVNLAVSVVAVLLVLLMLSTRAEVPGTVIDDGLKVLLTVGCGGALPPTLKFCTSWIFFDPPVLAAMPTLKALGAAYGKSTLLSSAVSGAVGPLRKPTLRV